MIEAAKEEAARAEAARVEAARLAEVEKRTPKRLPVFDGPVAVCFLGVCSARLLDETARLGKRPGPDSSSTVPPDPPCRDPAPKCRPADCDHHCRE